MKSEHTIRILGRDLVVKSDATPEHLKAVESLVAERLGPFAALPHQQALMLLALDLADELLRERASHQQLKEKIRERSSALLERLAVRQVA